MINNLPKISGEYFFNFDTSKISFMKVGGICDLLFVPKDINDLMFFILNKPQNLPIIIIGNLSNTIVTDRGIRGCCISLKNLNNIKVSDNYLEVECGIIINNFIKFCIKNNISCCEQLYMIPATIGGTLAMNAGTPLFEIKNIVKSIKLLNLYNGNILTIDNSKMVYRNGNLPKYHVAISCTLRIHKMSSNIIQSIVKSIIQKRIETQPINAKTCGSTFKNPIGYKAWQLIKESGCCRLQIGDAKVSDKHCNFIINEGKATSTDVINLIKLIREKVFHNTGILLEPEVKIIGEQ